YIKQCWHCGRKAIETCSGCNIARYCGQYCQHRDWELHQKLCGSDFKRKFSDSSLLYRRSHSKFNINISSNHQKDVTRKNSDARTTPYLDVSSPLIDETITIIKSNDNSDNKSEIEKIEVNTSKSENI
ncbi:unnamed protein product, partial [Adineta steineri]